MFLWFPFLFLCLLRDFSKGFQMLPMPPLLSLSFLLSPFRNYSPMLAGFPDIQIPPCVPDLHRWPRLVLCSFFLQRSLFSFCCDWFVGLPSLLPCLGCLSFLVYYRCLLLSDLWLFICECKVVDESSVYTYYSNVNWQFPIIFAHYIKFANLYLLQ